VSEYTEAAIFRKKTPPTATVGAGANGAPFNKEATWWLGMWLESRHSVAKREKRDSAAPPARREMGLSPANCREVVTACIQSIAMVGSELWRPDPGHHWSRERGSASGQPRGTGNDRLISDNQPWRPIDGVRTQSSGITAGEKRATVRPPLLSLPRGDQAREMVGAPTAIVRRLASALAYVGRRGQSYSEPETLDTELLQEEKAEAKGEAENVRPGHAMFTDRSRLDDGATGYVVVWKNGQSWVGIKTYMDTIRMPMTRSAPSSQGRWNRLHEDRQRRRGPQSSRTPKPPSDGWPQRSLAPAKNTRSRRGGRLQHYGKPGRTSLSRSDGARRTREPHETRRPTNGPTSRQRSQTPTG